MFEGWWSLLRPWCKLRGYHAVKREDIGGPWLFCRTCWAEFRRSAHCEGRDEELVLLMPDNRWVCAREIK